MSTWKTEVVKSFNGWHQVKLTIDHQSFLFEEKESEEGMTSRKYAEWHKSMIDVAINRLLSSEKKTETQNDS